MQNDSLGTFQALSISFIVVLSKTYGALFQEIGKDTGKCANIYSELNALIQYRKD